MAKKSSKYDNIELTNEELRQISDQLNAAGKNSYENWEKAVREATQKKRQSAMEEDLLAEWEKILPQLQEYYTNQGTVIGGIRSASEEAYGNTLAKFVRKMQDAGLDPYSFDRTSEKTPLSKLISEVRTAVEAASERGWGLPYSEDLNWEPYVNKYQDELYQQRLNNGSDQAQFNFGLNGSLDGLDEAALQRNAMLPNIPVREDTPEQEDYISRLTALMQEQPGLTGDQYRALLGENPFTNPADNTPVEEESYYNEPGPGYWATVAAEEAERNSAAKNTRTVTPEQITEAARNSTPGWMSDEFEDINTRAVGNADSGVRWNQDYRDRLANAMNGNTVPTNTAAAGAATTGTAYQDYLAGLSAQGGANAGYSRPSGTSYRAGSAGGKRSLTPDIQRQAYQSMLDALVRGSNGGMPTTNGFGAANKIYDNMRKEITDPKPVYEQYGVYKGNTLTRDKDYNYLNRLLNIKK